jgi:hypothetical protein
MHSVQPALRGAARAPSAREGGCIVFAPCGPLPPVFPPAVTVFAPDVPVYSKAGFLRGREAPEECRALACAQKGGASTRNLPFRLTYTSKRAVQKTLRCKGTFVITCDSVVFTRTLLTKTQAKELCTENACPLSAPTNYKNFELSPKKRLNSSASSYELVLLDRMRVNTYIRKMIIPGTHRARR